MLLDKTRKTTSTSQPGIPGPSSQPTRTSKFSSVYPADKLEQALDIFPSLVSLQLSNTVKRSLLLGASWLGTVRKFGPIPAGWLV